MPWRLRHGIPWHLVSAPSRWAALSRSWDTRTFALCLLPTSLSWGAGGCRKPLRGPFPQHPPSVPRSPQGQAFMGDFLSAGGAALDELLRLRGLPSNNTAHQFIMWIRPLLSYSLLSLFLGRGHTAGRSGLSRRLILGPWPMETGRQVWLLSMVYSPAPVLASSLSFLVCEMGVRCLDPPRFGHVGPVVVLGAVLSLSCPQPSCRLQPLGARTSSQTLSLAC